VLALAYPFVCMVVLYVVVLLAMIINVIDRSRWAKFSWSTREWRVRCLAIWARVILFKISLGLRPLYVLCFSTLHSLLELYLVYAGTVVCSGCRGCVKDPKTTLLYFYRVTFPLIWFNN